MKTYEHFSEAQLKAELEKCVSCAAKPCLEACPSHCSPADFIMAAKLQSPSDYARAAEEILSKNPLGHVCGIVCPDTFCMDACSRKEFDYAVNIPKIQASILEQARKLKVLANPAAVQPNGKKIAVIGAGPAGLAGAASLARKGYAVDLFDEETKAGGACLMIPEARLPREALEGDIEYILSHGKITPFFGTRIENPKALLEKGYDAVLLAVGDPEATLLGITGEELAVSSLNFLRHPESYVTFLKAGQRVAVIGGGAVAADCATRAQSLGADVEMFVRRTLGEMPLTAVEREMLVTARIDITTRTRLQEIEIGANNTLTLKTTKVAPGKPGKDGRAKLEDLSGTSVPRSGFSLVVMAVGSEFTGDYSGQKGFFVAGDCREGASTVVQAAASGKNAALEIDHFLFGQVQTGATALKKTSAPGTRSRIKSRETVQGIRTMPVSLGTDFFGIPIHSPFLLSAAPATDGIEQMKHAYEAGWAGGVMKTAFDNTPIHIPGQYMVTFGEGAKTHGNCDNVSGHPLDRVCRELEQLRKAFPDRLTMASTGGPVTGHDEQDAKVWQSNTRKLEHAGALGVEYSLSCPQGGDGTEGAIVSQSAAATAKVIDWVMQKSDPSIPKLFKLTSAVTSLRPILSAVKEVFDRYPGKKAGITLANSFPVMAFRKDPSVTRWDQGVVVGMSGEGVVPISYLALSEAAPFGLTVSGNGGVMDYRAAANFLALGAKSVQVCTVATRYGIEVVRELESGLSHYLHSLGIQSIAELVGRALPDPVTGFGELSATKMISDVNPKLCESCGNCTFCPYMAVTLDKNNHPVTDPSRCIGCTICVKQCFAGALVMRARTHEEAALLKE